ncbi:MAG: hypothetical protein NVS3B1_29570 [Marmoricola sp.]
MIERLTCMHCGRRVYRRPGSAGRYALTDRADGTDVFGSGSECPKRERGHEIQPVGRDWRDIHGTRTGWNTQASGCGDPTCITCYPNCRPTVKETS